MFKSFIIVVLAVYSAYMSIRYFDTKRENLLLKRYIDELRKVPLPDSSKIYEVYARRDTMWLIKTKIKKEYVKDTVYVYNVVPSDYYGERFVSFSWKWLEFLSVKDTIRLKMDSTGNQYANLYRYWKVLKPVSIFLSIYERKPEEYWWRGIVSPPEFGDYIDLKVYNDIKPYRLYAGMGVSFEKRIYPALGTSLVYNRHLVDLNVSLNSLIVTYKYRIN